MKTKLKQMTKSFFLGGFATIVDYLLFSILHFYVFISLINISFHFGPFNYEVGDGGLCTFLSMAISYLTGQVVNYFVQRKYAFEAKGYTNRHRFMMYVVSISIVYLIVLYIPGIIGVEINKIFGFVFGPYITKSIATFIGFLIQYPVNKYVIFKKTS